MIRKSFVIIGLVYDILLIPLVIIFIPISYFFKSTSKYRKSRASIIYLFKTLKKSNQRSILFYCSSVGEFEQSLPVIDEFKSNGYRCIIFFHSKNGFDYCHSISTHEKYLTPFDFFIVWSFIFWIVQPDLSIINRHEFWPGFLISSQLFSAIILINYVVKRHNSPIRFMAVSFSKIIFTTKHNAQVNQKYFYAGDTRNDRLIARQQQNVVEANYWRKKIRNNLLDTQSLVVIGNCYPEDYDILFSISNSELNQYKFLIIPCRTGFNYKHPSYIVGNIEIEQFDWSFHNTIIWETVGNLFEIYSAADIAWVGGGFSQGIHNCLEPAYYHIPIIAGPNLNEQTEAIFLQKESNLLIFKTKDELISLLNGNEFKSFDNFVKHITSSATNIILETLYENNYSRKKELKSST